MYRTAVFASVPRSKVVTCQDLDLAARLWAVGGCKVRSGSHPDGLGAHGIGYSVKE
ncbi:hypothetical protein PHLCEN_2v11599 [Hermanssonia centrifuga]|uniref:Uncharacterized protein n=1 Tax=Hermanssonia centrifuga TaxID=98765 RepID=A0A2R6NJI7_9APHY|nr:hypothetical protein PHLCEN_2v11599 [Hermanssonia centrifuga]